MIRFSPALLTAFLAALPLAPLTAEERAEGDGRAVALELVLAVDVSSSVSYDEFNLQMRGLADAFRNPRVAQAIAAAAPQGIAVTVMQWSGDERQAQVVPWTRVDSAESAEALARRIAVAPRAIATGPTALGDALAAAAGLIAGNGYQGARRVIDLSGDGRANSGLATGPVRAAVLGAGITINALAIMNEEPDLADYYSTRVIGGPGAFLATAADYADFARAITRKLVTEITGAPLAEAEGAMEVAESR